MQRAWESNPLAKNKQLVEYFAGRWAHEQIPGPKMGLKRAVNSLKDHNEAIVTPGDLRKLPGFGVALVGAAVNAGIFNPPSTPPIAPPSASSTPSAVPSLPLVRDFSIPDWLARIGLQAYAVAFVEKGYDNLLAIQELREQDLDAIGVSLPGHRKTLIEYSKAAHLQASASPAAPPAPTPPPPAVIPPSPVPALAAVPAAAQASGGPRVRVFVSQNGVRPTLTANYISSNTGAAATVLKGLRAYQADDVLSLVIHGTQIEGEVRDPKNERLPFKISLKVDARGQINKFECSCPKFASKGFGGLCKHLIAGLLAVHPALIPQLSSSLPAAAQDVPPTPPPAAPPAPRVQRKYVPRRMTGGWALTIALYNARFSHADGMKKDELIDRAQTYLPAASGDQVPLQMRPSAQDPHGGWKSMGTLKKNGLVISAGRPARFKLTAEGLEAAEHLNMAEDAAARVLIAASSEHQSNNTRVEPVKAKQRSRELFDQEDDAEKTDDHGLDVDTNESGPRHNKRSSPESEGEDASRAKKQRKAAMTEEPPRPRRHAAEYLAPQELEGAEPELIMLIDNRENKNNKPLQRKLMAEAPTVLCESRSLELGDVAWLLRVHNPQGAVEYMLDYIIERKTVADLDASIIDKRYIEQKFRLQKCGLRNLIYLVEGQLLPAKSDALLGEIMETQLGSFVVHRTSGDHNTILYLARIHERLESLLLDGKAGQLVQRVTYREFADRSSKNKNVVLRELFAKLLLQIRGCSPDKAAAVVAHYGTPRALLQDLRSMFAIDALDKLASLRTATAQRVGRSLAEAIIAAFTSADATAPLPRLSESQSQPSQDM